jgi:ribosome-associated protein
MKNTKKTRKAPVRKRTWPARETVRIARAAAEEKKAEDIVALDMRAITPLADVFFICTAHNERQAEAIARAIEESLEKAGIPVLGMEGLRAGRWVVMDCGDVFIHVFLPAVRSFYSLETLWGDAPKLK